MQTFSPFDPFNTLKKAELPSRVVEEVYPIFERVLAPELDVIIGVSSGVDSMAVVCLLALRYVQRQRPLTHLHIVHCNHKIRKQSEIEAAFIQAFFSGWEVQIFERPASVSTTEQALRERRYRCWRQAKGGMLMLGHHLEDRVESTFLNAIRGCGLKGFVNMQILQPHPLLSFPVCRPLLNITKPQIIAFCQQFGIPYFEDETNANLATSQRNFLRHEIIGKLVGMKSGKGRFLESMKQVYAELDASSRLTSSFSMMNVVKAPAWNAEYAYVVQPPFSIVEIWDTLGIALNLRTSQIQERTQRITETQSGRKEFHGVYFFFHQKQLYVIKAKKRFRQSYLPDQQPILEVGTQMIAGVYVEVKEKRLIGSTLRFPKPGDRFAGKTWNRWCLNQKIPLFWRNFIPIAVKEGKIIHLWKVYEES